MMRSSLVLAICLATSAARADQPSPDPDPDVYRAPCRSTSPSTKLALSFGPEATVAQLAMWISTTTCKSVVFDATLGKSQLKATIVAPNRYTVKQALELVLDAIEATGLVVTQKPDSYVIKPGPNMPKCDVAVAPDPALDETEPDLQDEIDNGILKLDDQNYAIDRALAKKLLSLPPGLGKQARIVPAMSNGKPDGLKLYAIRPNSAVAQLGFMNGDTLKSIGGTAIPNLDSLEALRVKLAGDAKLGKIAIAVVRRSKPFTWSILVK